MKELTVEVVNNEIWLKCRHHGLIKFFGVYASLSDIIVAEQDHATLHLHELHDLTDVSPRG